MVDLAPALLHLTILEKMIGRAEVACDRYRRSAQRENPSKHVVRSRRQALQQMERALSRLQAERRVDQTGQGAWEPRRTAQGVRGSR